MKSIILLPALYQELLAWHRRGYARFHTDRLMECDLDQAGSPKIEDHHVLRLGQEIPRFEYPYEVVLLTASRSDLDILKVGPTFAELDLSKVLAIYPLSDSGKATLNDRIGAEMLIGDPLLEREVEGWQIDWFNESMLRGGLALLRIVAVPEELPSPAFRNALVQSFHGRVRQGTLPNPDLLVDQVILYDRRGGNIPDSDIGSVVDLGIILWNTYVPNRNFPADEESLATLRGEYRLLSQSPNLADFLIQSVRLRGELEAQLIESGDMTVAAAVMYLELRRRIEALTDRRVSALREVIQEFLELLGKGVISQRDVAQAIFSAGAFLEFTPLAAEYYAGVPWSTMKPLVFDWPITIETLDNDGDSFEHPPPSVAAQEVAESASTPQVEATRIDPAVTKGPKNAKPALGDVATKSKERAIEGEPSRALNQPEDIKQIDSAVPSKNSASPASPASPASKKKTKRKASKSKDKIDPVADMTGSELKAEDLGSPVEPSIEAIDPELTDKDAQLLNSKEPVKPLRSKKPAVNPPSTKEEPSLFPTDAKTNKPPN